MTQPSNAVPRVGTHESNDFISVREAARRLGVSTNKIYRMSRDGSGPFRILNHDRHVLIERVDFERYLSERSPASGERTASVTHRESLSDDQGASNPVDPTTTVGCGQRELVMPARRPFVVIYMA
jgi:excisionase family DNA binding protein